eukprot:3470467-Pyramimonas_sp.AAC.1
MGFVLHPLRSGTPSLRAVAAAPAIRRALRVMVCRPASPDVVGAPHRSVAGQNQRSDTLSHNS